jgi:hypothetical protein
LRKLFEIFTKLNQKVHHRNNLFVVVENSFFVIDHALLVIDYALLVVDHPLLVVGHPLLVIDQEDVLRLHPTL